MDWFNLPITGSCKLTASLETLVWVIQDPETQGRRVCKIRPKWVVASFGRKVEIWPIKFSFVV